MLTDDDTLMLLSRMLIDNDTFNLPRILTDDVPLMLMSRMLTENDTLMMMSRM